MCPAFPGGLYGAPIETSLLPYGRMIAGPYENGRVVRKHMRGCAWENVPPDGRYVGPGGYDDRPICPQGSCHAAWTAESGGRNKSYELCMPPTATRVAGDDAYYRTRPQSRCADMSVEEWWSSSDGRADAMRSA